MKSNGLATILLMIPVLTVPALAIFGIPQFAPVVASPLEESGTNDRENRVGNSARLSHDELFDDIEGLDPETTTKTGVTSSLRERSPSNRSQRIGRVRRPQEQASTTWGDDLERVPDHPKPTRSPSPRATEPLGDFGGDPPNGETISKDRSGQDRLRYDRSTGPAGKKPNLNRQAPSADSDNPIKQAGYREERSRPEKLPDSASEDRPKPTGPRNSKPREPAVEDLTWSAAVERLNELDIRSFRLEPGPRMGLFVFICSYTSPDAPSVSYRFEAEADQPLKAVQKVLEQIVDWRQRR